tara:strand:+ start:146 stop:397 length:252 start_codon:yes stop_codon:yes gene_type:complete
MSNYKLDVLQAHAADKKESYKLGHNLGLIKNGKNCPKSHKSFINKIAKNADLFKEFESTVRKTKKGNYVVFYTRQAIHRFLSK